MYGYNGINTMKLQKIGELAKSAGVTIRTVRYYQELGLLKPVKYTSGRIGLYEPSTRSIILAVLSLKQIGASLEEIKSIFTIRRMNKNVPKTVVLDSRRIMEDFKRHVSDKVALYRSILDRMDSIVKKTEGCAGCPSDDCSSCGNFKDLASFGIKELEVSL